LRWKTWARAVVQERRAFVRIHRRSGKQEAPSVSDIDPSDLSLVGRRAVSEKFNSDVSDATSNGKPEREGLPASYRMRADAHYVDQLPTRRVDRAEAYRTAGSPSDGSDQDSGSDARERRSDRVLFQLGEEISAITSAAGLLAAGTSPLARRLSVDLIRAQAWRAAWLLRASAMIDGRQRGQRKTRPLGGILEQARQGLVPECRLAGVALQMHSTDWNAMVLVDEQILVAGITGAVVATLAIIGETDGAVIRVSVEAAGNELRTIEVTQDEVAVGSTATLRFFDPTWADRPGGWSAGLGAMSARSAAQQHGGTAVFVLGDRRGTTVRMNLSRTH
jgi:hypothetical protein